MVIFGIRWAGWPSSMVFWQLSWSSWVPGTNCNYHCQVHIAIIVNYHGLSGCQVHIAITLGGYHIVWTGKYLQYMGMREELNCIDARLEPKIWEGHNHHILRTDWRYMGEEECSNGATEFLVVGGGIVLVATLIVTALSYFAGGCILAVNQYLYVDCHWRWKFQPRGLFFISFSLHQKLPSFSHRLHSNLGKKSTFSSSKSPSVWSLHCWIY